MSTLVCKHDIYIMQSRNKLIRPVSGTKDDFNLEATLAENSRAKVQAKSEGCVSATPCDVSVLQYRSVRLNLHAYLRVLKCDIYMGSTSEESMARNPMIRHSALSIHSRALRLY